MLVDGKTPYCGDVTSSQLELESQYHHSQITARYSTDADTPILKFTRTETRTQHSRRRELEDGHYVTLRLIIKRQ